MVIFLIAMFSLPEGTKDYNLERLIPTFVDQVSGFMDPMGM